MAKKSAKTRSTSEIEADLNATRERLTFTVESLIDQVHPNRVKQRGAARVKLVANEYADKAKSLVFNARGDLRRERLAAVGGGVGGFLTLVIVLRLLLRRIRSRRDS